MYHISTLSSGSSNTLMMDQGTKERSASKMVFEKFLKEQWVIKVGGGLGTAQLS